MIRILINLGVKSMYYFPVVIIILNTQVVMQMLYGEYIAQVSPW